VSINYTVANEQTRKSTEYVTGDIIKVQSSYDGNFRIYQYSQKKKYCYF